MPCVHLIAAAAAAAAAECSGAEAYIAFGNKRYFKDFNTYSQQLASFKVQPSALGFEPAWFFDQVDPLAGLNLHCNNG